MVTIRVASPGDLGVVGVLHVRSWQDAYAPYVPAAMLHSFTPETRIEEWRTAVARGVVVLVAVRDDAVLGFGAVDPAPALDDAPSGDAYLSALHTDPELRGGGIGVRLVEALADLVRDSAEQLRVHVLDDNLDARRFYERHGFVADGTHKIEPRLGLPETRLARPLA